MEKEQQESMAKAEVVWLTKEEEERK